MIRKLMATLGLTMALAATAGCDRAEAKTTPTAAERVARGKYIVNTAGCNDCHTPWKMGPKGPEPDMTLALSGHPESMKMPAPPKMGEGPWVWAGAGTNTAFAGPWGVSYTANLTPDKLTGLGIWTEDTFIKTIRTGRHWGVSRPILPPMPWAVYRNLTDEDLKSVFAYLHSIKPIHNQVPEPLPPPAGLFAAGAVIGGLSSLFAVRGAFLSVPFLSWCNVPIKRASGTPAANGFPIALAGSVGYIAQGLRTEGLPPGSFGYVYLPALALIAVTSMLAAPFGARLVHRAPIRPIRIAFALLMYAVGVKLLANLW